MPNHVRNTIHIDCSEERLREILEAIQYDDNGDHRECGLGTIDFNKIIPMPPSLNIEAGSSTDRGLKAYRDFIDVYTLMGTRTGLDLLNIPKESEEAFLKARTDVERRDFDLGRTAFKNIQEYGADTWYDWSIRNWGTKWNSYDPDEYHGGHDIGFSTAWSAPHPILHKLMEMCPDAEITHRWADEDLGQNCGEIFYSDGLIDENIPDDGSKEAQDLAFEMWGETPEELGYALSADGSRYIYTECEEYDLIEICGQPALFDNGRFTDENTPAGLYHYDLRQSDTGDGFATIEPKVRVNHGGSVVMNEALDFGTQGYIALTDETSPNFLGEKLSLRQFLNGDFEQDGGVKLE